LTDNLTPEKRSKVMASIRGRDTGPELMLWRVLDHRMLRRYPPILGNPDIGCKRWKVAIFVDGCFWHACPRHYKPPTLRAGYWRAKLERNVNRDREITQVLRSAGYEVLRFWEHEVVRDPVDCAKKVMEALQNQRGSQPKAPAVDDGNRAHSG
jgi:DNA mismatch endonuclease (patch repair protein)